MNDQLKISRKKDAASLILEIEGRIDAYWAGLLADSLEEEIRNSNYNIILKLDKVNYISSAGIRILVKYYKQLKNIGGYLMLADVSENVRSVLDMVGMASLFDNAPQEEEAKEAVEKPVRAFSFEGLEFTIENITADDKAEISLWGHTEPGSKTPAEGNGLRYDRPLYALGIGGFGADADDSRHRFGEFIGIDDVLACQPSGAGQQPDYMLRSGTLIPEIFYQYAISFGNIFNKKAAFSHSESLKSSSLSKILNKVTDIEGCKSAAFVMLAESRGMVGVSAAITPDRYDNIDNYLGFPEVRDTVYVTTEPEYDHCLAICCGIIHHEDDKRFAGFTRPINKEYALFGHVHAAIFSYHPLKKDKLELRESMQRLIEADKLLRIMHLINDDRDSTGIGESEFKQGHIWFSSADNLNIRIEGGEK